MKNYIEYNEWLDENYLSAEYPTDEEMEMLKEYYKNHHPWNFGKRKKVKVKRIRGEAVKEYKWFNNGIKNIRCKECPEGFKKGRLPFKNKLV